MSLKDNESENKVLLLFLEANSETCLLHLWNCWKFPIKRHYNCTNDSNVPLSHQHAREPLTSHRNKQITAQTYKSAPETLNASKTS